MRIVAAKMWNTGKSNDRAEEGRKTTMTRQFSARCTRGDASRRMILTGRSPALRSQRQAP
jgi:hypothetical protein